MNKNRKGISKKIGILAFAFVAIVSALTLIVGLGTKAFKSKTINSADYKAESADWPSNPEPKKLINSNHDGTYTISLDVTGDADTTVPDPPRVNVLIVFDNSNSMDTFGAEYEESERGRFGNVDGEYFVLYRNTNGQEVGEGQPTPAGTIYYRDGAYPNYDYHPYTNGTRYTKLRSRADAAEKVVYDFTTSLFSYQDKGGDETNIQMSLVTFNNNTTLVSDWTSTEADITRRLSKTGASGSAGLGHNSGTNYEAALQRALQQLAAADGDQTFVIFVTDGAPSQYVGMPANPAYLRPELCYGHSQDEALRISTYDTTTHTDISNANYSGNSNTTLYGIYAYGDEADYLDDVIYYALNNGVARDPEREETDETENYFNASNTASLTSAMSHIFDKIIETFGVTDVEIQDGTTDQVKTSTEGVTSHLLEVDTSSFRYWLTIPLIENKFTRIDTSNGDTIEYTVVDNGNGTATVTWEGHSVTVNGEVNVGTLKYEWTEANELYPKNPPAAEYSSTSSKVDWDLSEVGTLLNDVTYTVTFVVYPSQEYNDTIADLKNGYLDYVLPDEPDPRPNVKNLDSELTKYIIKDEATGEYTLKTNTGATVSWKDTRNDDPEQEYTYTYEPPEPVQTDPDQINVLKRWENAYDAKQVGEIIIGVNKDGSQYTTVELNDDNNWVEGPINIAAGLMRVHYASDDTTITSTEILTPGHDFTFEELGEDSYNWEMIAQTIHPMSVNGTLRELVLVNDQVQKIYTLGTNGAGVENPIAVPAIPTYMKEHKELWFYQDSTGTFYRLAIAGEEEEDKVYYQVPKATNVSGQEDNQIPTIRAYNYRRSNLNIQKVVDGDSANPDDLFEFTIKVDDEGLSDGEELWFSVYKGGYIDLTPEGANEESRFVGTAWTEKKDIVYVKDEDGNPTSKVDHIEYYYHAAQGTQLVVKLKAGENLRFTNLTTQAKFTAIESGKEDAYVYKKASEDSFKAWYGNGANSHLITDEDYLTWDVIYDEEDPTKEIGISGEITVTNASFYVYIENTYELVDVDVEKEWDDNDNQDGIRPDSVEVSLLADGEQVTTESTTCEPTEEGGEAPETCPVPVKATLDENNHWKYTFEDLPRYKDDKEIVYTVVETEIAIEEGHETGYTTTIEDLREVDKVTGEITTEGKFIYKVINTHIPEETEASVLKVWDDDSNRDGIRPTSLTVNLLADGEAAQMISTTCTAEAGKEAPATCLVAVGDITLTAENNWTQGVTRLPKYKAGKEIEYTWSESGLPSGYTLQDPSVNGTVTTLTNTHTPVKTEATVVKVWDDDGNRDNKRPESLTVNLLANGQAAKKYTTCAADATDCEVTLVEVGPITLDEDNDWTYEVENLPKNASGEEIKYTWTEGTLPTGYTLTGNTANGTITTLTNSYIPEKTEASVIKVWNDNGDQDGKRPESLTVNLLADGQAAKKYTTCAADATNCKVELVEVGPITLNEQNNWTYEVENLPKNASGEEIKYTWTEGTLPTGYTLTGNTANGTVTTLTNTLTPEKTEATIVKVWNDNNDQDGIRPQTLTVNLMAGNEAAKAYTVCEDNDEDCEVTLVAVGPITLNETNNWTYKVENLPKNASGEEIKYTWTEGTLPTGYTLTSNTTSGTVTTITNTHTPEVVKAKVVKVWNDNEDQDGIRPETLSVTLTNYDGTITLDPTNGWSTTIENLPKYADGELIEYTWTEGTLPEGYELESTTPADLTEGEGEEAKVVGKITTIKNKHVPEVVKAKVVKEWNDADDQDGIRPQSLTVTLSNYTSENDLVLNKGNGWSLTIENLPKYADGEEIEYTWTEGTLPEGYTLESTTPADLTEGEGEEAKVVGKITTIKNKHVPEVTKVTVVKEWNDNEDQDGIRPETLSVTLSNGQSVTLSESNDWTQTIENLPKYADGEEITYTWTEGELPNGYELESTTPADITENGVVVGKITTIKNKHVPEVTEATVKKVWDDADNQDGKRPTSLTVTLSNGESVTLNETNKWTQTVTGLPKYADGEEIAYTWTEGTLPEGYKLTNTSVNGTVTTLTNSHTPEKTEATVTKVWEDKDNQDGKRPASLTVNLLANGQAAKKYTTCAATATDCEVTLVAVGPITLDEDNDWTYKVDNLPKNANGVEIKYTWTEGTLPTGYELTGNTTNGTVTTLENTYKPEEVSVSVLKVWDDNDNQDGLRGDVTFVLTGSTNDPKHPYSKTYEKTLTIAEQATSLEYVWQGLPAYDNGNKITYSLVETAYPEGYTPTVVNNGTVYSFKVTNSHTPEETEATVKKVWDDAGDQDGKRPETLSVTLSDGQSVTLSDANDWTQTVTGLPKYADGVEIKYTWTEGELPEGYTLTDTSVNGTITTLTNSRPTEETEATVTKEWIDDDNRDGIRPESLTVTLSNGDSVTLSEDNDWTATIKGLPRYADGVEIKYTWTEGELPEGYTLTSNTTSGTITTIKNSHVPERVKITATKSWDDNDDQDGIRPESVLITLLADGAETVSKEANEGNDWTVTFDNLNKYLKGKEIVYSVKETVPNGYKEAYSGSAEKGFVITNTHTPATIDIDVEKKWEDEDNHDGKRPTTITVNLLADGTKVGSKTMSAENNWAKVTFTELPEKANGKTINYSVTEEAVTDYEGVVTPVVVNKSYKIVNTHPVEYRKIEGIKVWKDSDNRDNLRPETVTIRLYADGEEVADTTTNAAQEWKYEFDNLPKYKNVDNKPHEIVYTVDEDPVSGYTKGIDGYTITNTHEPLVTKVSGTKTWTDGDDIEGFRPESITVNLLADGKKIDSAVVSAETEWKFEFANLPQYKEGEVGKEIAYTISEEDVEGYSVSLTRSGSNPEITIDIENIHTPEYTTISGVKTWKDDDDIEGFRPESITINLLADGEKIDSKTVTEADEWKWSFENLPAHKKGKEVTYSITEETIEGYTTEVTGYNVINTHTPEYVSYTIEKLWVDDDDRDGIRPESITINLLADGEKIDSKTVTEAEEWSCKFEGLTKYKKGKLVTYSITEDVVENYTSSITDITDTTTSVIITNTHDPARTEISGKKIWEEDQNYLDRRPDMVTVNIYADGVYLDTIKVKKEDNWEYIVSNLYKYSKGVEIKYTIEEEPVEGYEAVYDGYDITNIFTEGEGCVGPDCNPPKTMIDVEANNYTNYNTIVFLIAGFGALIQKRRISGN